MKYSNPAIDSSYFQNNLGKSLYDIVLKTKPLKVVEFGVLFGYSTVAMAMALDEIGKGKIYAYDLFEKYPFKHSSKNLACSNIKKYNLSNYVEVAEGDFEKWLLSPEQFDLLHVDVSNNGLTIEKLYKAVKNQIENGAIVVFEGGSSERDNVEWMKKYKHKKIGETDVPYTVINGDFPSLSIIKK